MTAQQRLARLAGLVPTGSSSAARTPFVLLIVALLGAGMLALLLLNAALNQGSFELSELRRETSELTDEQQALQAEVDAFSAPDALAERARELGLVPGGPPVFLRPDGGVLGVPEAAPEPEPEPEPEPVPRPDPDPDSPPAVPEGDTPNGGSADGTEEGDPDTGTDTAPDASGEPTDPTPEE
ncbi:septum formation initiator, partial [Streptomyces alkaliphilus]